MTLLAAPQAPAVVHATTMARQPNHHHHHHHVASNTPSSATTKGLFDLSQLVADGYVGYGGSYVVPSTSHLNNRNVRSTTAQQHLLPPAAITTLRLTGREDFTRVQLQKQRVGEHHHHYYSASIVGDRIPGFKTSAGKCFSWELFYIDLRVWRMLVDAVQSIPHMQMQLIDNVNKPPCKCHQQ
jgi:hypothetical protein